MHDGEANRPTNDSKPDGDAPPDSEPKTVHVQARFPAWPDAETRFANHLGATFDGSNFYLTVGQVPMPAITQADKLIDLLESGPIPGRILGQFAIPVDKWIEAIDKFHEVVQRLRREGIIQQVERQQEGS
jgi:hypothetical protein